MKLSCLIKNYILESLTNYYLNVPSTEEVQGY